MKKKIIIIVIALILIGSWFILLNYSKERIGQDCQIVYPEKTSYIKQEKIKGTTIASEVVRYPLKGYLISSFVNVGTLVEVGDKLVEINNYEDNEIIKAKHKGVVYEINDSYISLSISKSILSFYVDENIKNQIKVGDNIKAGEYQAIISFISNVPIRNDDSVLYEVNGYLNQDISLGKELMVTINTNQYDNVYKINSDCVLTNDKGSFVIYASWLDHVTSFSSEDYYKVKILGNIDNDLMIEQMPNKEILKLDELTIVYLKELFK